MDISFLSTKDNAESGQWFQFEGYGKKWPFDLKILGGDSDAVQKYNRKRLRSELFGKIQSGKFEEMTDDDYEAVDDLSDEAILVRLVDIRGYKYAPEDKKHRVRIDYEPVVLFGRELKPKREDFRYLIEQMPAVKDFVLKVSGERTNFLSERKENLS
ncbi:MAG: hypothetical protein LBF77_10175 [Spirochaetaceae bacterium]|jgi:hypothetical protein|nr:hypothetical protein [Spirochaetaceae bacterium]